MDRQKKHTVCLPEKASRTLRGAWALGAAAVVLGVADPGQAAMITIQPGHAVTIRNDKAGTPQSNDSQLIVGEIDADKTLRGLLSFDLSALEAATGGQPITISSVTLVLRTASAAGTVGDIPHSPFELVSYLPFDEATATWNDPQGNVGDDVAGGTPGIQLSSASFDPATDTQEDQTFASSAAFIAAAETAMTRADNTLYMLLYHPVAEGYHTGYYNGTRDYFARFDSDDAGSADNRPRLIIDYNVIPEPASMMLLGAGVLPLLSRRRSAPRI